MKPSNDKIGSETGLSDKSIEILSGVNISKNSDILNFLIEHPRFKELLRSMKILSYHSTGKYAELISDSYREYKLYQASGIIRQMCQDAYNDPVLEKEPAYDITLIGDKGEPNQTFIFDPCEVALEKREIDFIDRTLEGNLEISRLMSEAQLRQATERTAWIAEDEQIEGEREKHDPILRFYRRMTRTVPDDDQQEE